MKKNEPWPPGKATQTLWAYAKDDDFDLLWTEHAFEREDLRDINIGDVKHILKFGYVYKEGVPATQDNCFKYQMECTTPNSNGRTVRIIIIPSPDNKKPACKLVTVMWVD